ncbi:permease [Alistipes sp.]|uniref:permease n=1 Tax=Alistipes sp. TaxID=1872444 RepID=UPI003AEFD61C
MQEYILPLVYLLGEMSPYLLLGFLIAGLLHAFVPRRLYSDYLAGSDFRSVALAALFGVPLPLCSCGVIPTAMSMRREGASRAATVSFLVSTPQTGVDSIFATASLLGLPFALVRPVAAFVTALFGGVLTGALVEESPGGRAETYAAEHPQRTFGEKCRAALRYGFVEMMQDIGRWLVAGLVLAGLVTVLLPDGFFAAFHDRPLLNMLLVLALSVPMYLCATGSIPIAAALMLKGLSPGAALVLLMAGPATNLAAMLVIGKVLGRRTLLCYLAAILAGAIGFGLAVDYLLPSGWFTSVLADFSPAHCAAAGPVWWKTLSSVLFLALLARAFLLKYRTPKIDTHMKRTFRIEGMVCNHCKSNVEQGLARIPGVASVEVDLAQGVASVEGEAAAEEIVAAIEQLGYECEERSS